MLFGTAVGVAQAQSPSPITIKIIEGDHAINSIRMKRGHDPVVQVLSGSGEPIAGATVSFLLPASGAGATLVLRGVRWYSFGATLGAPSHDH